ncbi:uncharacterized protein LOC124276425 isoform X2 [Haliotis rubra]|uniref:uncharacterized protein LOC124276425 isoform X2 n=1 Tax=Haliotis rubra TaxID=36100 RepID=UPI001EE4ED24|nr:uncharacterized protein LOC124276425 isoform X2 [Haliotis rubra]
MTLRMKWIKVLLTLSLSLTVVGGYSDTTVTIHPQWLAQGGSARYDNNRWNKHNNLDQPNLIPNCRRLRTDSGRWGDPDTSSRLFQEWPEDPNRSGYPDPNYLKNVTIQQQVCSRYVQNINTVFENDMIMVTDALEFPSWIDTSDHDGHFPNNVDAAAEFMMLLVQGIYDYTKGRIPPYIEPINEPDYQCEYGRGDVIGFDKYAPSPIIDFSTIYQSNAHRFTQLGLREYIDRAVAFLLASEERPGRYSLNYSLFTPDGKPTRIVDVYEFWYKFASGFSFIRTTSQYDGEERTVSPLAMSSSSTNETVILLHSYSRRSQAVKLVFQGDWIKPTTGQATCTTIKDDWFPVITFNETIDIQNTQGIVELPPESTCHFTFNTPSNKLPSVTLNETTYYGADTLIPIKGDVVSTVISLPNGQYDSARLRVSTSWLINETNSVHILPLMTIAMTLSLNCMIQTSLILQATRIGLFGSL